MFQLVNLENNQLEMYLIHSHLKNRDSFSYLINNSVAVKKGATLFKMASVKKVVKSKGR